MGWSDDYLEHHGILGQKWGIRRFQNKDGSLTPAGRKRILTEDGYIEDKAKERKINRLYDKRDAKRYRISDKINKNTEREIKKRTGLSLEEATKKAIAQNKDLDSGKLKWEDSLWNDINKAEYTKKNLKLEEKSRKIDDKYMKKIDDVRESKGLTDKQKKLIIAGAAVAGTALAAYGGYKLYQLNKEAKEGLSNDYHKQAVNEFVKSRKLEAKYYGDLSSKTYNAAMDARDKAEALQDLAKSKKYSIGEKAAYLNNQKAKVSAKGQTATNKLASEASSLARSVTAEGPKNFSKPSQNGPTKEQITQQKLKAAQESRPKIDRATVSHTPIDRIQVDKATVNRIKVDRTPINMDSFNKAAQANDDLVQELLKKNAKNLGL